MVNGDEVEWRLLALEREFGVIVLSFAEAEWVLVVPGGVYRDCSLSSVVIKAHDEIIGT